MSKPFSQRPPSSRHAARASYPWLPGAMVGLLVLLVVSYVLWYRYSHEQVTKVEYRPSTESLRNPFYASNLLLERAGKEVHTLGGVEGDRQISELLSHLEDAHRHALVLDGDLAFYEADAVLDWVRAGGHLLVGSSSVMWMEDEDSPTTDTSEQDHQDTQSQIITALGVRHLSLSSEYGERGKETGLDTFYAPLRLPDGKIIVAKADGWLDDSELYRMHQDARPVADYRLLWQNMPQAEADARLASLSAPERQKLQRFVDDNPAYYQPNQVLVDAYLGQGRVTVLTDLTGLFGNPMIDNDIPKSALKYQEAQAKKQQVVGATDGQDKHPRWYDLLTYQGDYLYYGRYHKSKEVFFDGVAQVDNAYLLRYLTQDQQAIWWVTETEKPSLFALMREHMPFFLFGLPVLVLMGLLALPRRFGQVRTPQDDSETNFLDYFSSMGAYLWQADKAHQLAHGNRTRLLAKLAARLPTLRHAKTDAERVQVISDDCGLPSEMVYLALYGTWQAESEFLAATQAFAVLSQYYER